MGGGPRQALRLIAVGKLGKGLTGCLRYVLGEGRDPAAARDDAPRVAWIGGQGFEGWTPHDRDTADLARRVMEFAAAHQTSTTRLCEKDCLHLILSWRTGERPPRHEMDQAGREALAAVGMKNARAVFVAHTDKDHAHLHIVASRLNPVTGRAFGERQNYLKWQRWALKWEQRHGGIQCPRRMRRTTATLPRRYGADLVKRRSVREAAPNRAGRPSVGAETSGGTILASEPKAALWASAARQTTCPVLRSRKAKSGKRRRRPVAGATTRRRICRHGAAVGRKPSRREGGQREKADSPRRRLRRRVGGGKGGGWKGTLPRAPVLWPTAAAQTGRREKRDERRPFRPHRHGKGFTCNACKEWHPEGMMHCELV